MPARRDKRSGRWRYRKLIKLPDGSRKRINGTPTKNTKLAAEEEEMRHMEREIKAFYEQQYAPPTAEMEVPTFAEWFEGRFWREWVIGRKNKPSEQVAKRSIFETHLKDRFGAMRLDEIGAGEIAQMRADFIERKLSDKRINNILAVLSKALRYAASVRLIEGVPAIGLLRLERPEIECWDFEQYARILGAAREEGEEWYTAACLAGEAGLRIGEVRALRWREDVDLIAGTITVNQQTCKGTTGTPKGRTRRTIPMNERLTRALRQLAVIREGYVVRNPLGTPLRDGQCSHTIYRICRRAGLPERAWHTLRHSFGTHAAHLGVNPWRLMQWLGHKRIDETMRYVHFAEAHMRPLPDVLITAGQGIADSDRRVLAMLSKRGNVAGIHGNIVATTQGQITQTPGVSMS
jgi:integrase